MPRKVGDWQHLREAGSRAYLEANGDYTTAANLFKSSVGDQIAQSHAARFIRTRGERKTLTGDLQHLPKGHHPYKISRKEVRRCNKIFNKVYTVRGVQKPFEPINEPLAYSGALRSVLDKYDVAPITMLRAMKPRSPTRHRTSVVVRAPFTEDVKQQRL